MTNPATPITGPSLSPSDIFLAAKEGPERGCGVIWFPHQTPGSSRRRFGLWAGKQDSTGTKTQAGAPSWRAFEGAQHDPISKGKMTFYLRSFWLRKPSFIFSTTLASIELASLAKSRSRISDTGTETMAKASLSSLVGHVPSWEARGMQHHTDRAMPSTSPPPATNPVEPVTQLIPRTAGVGSRLLGGLRLVSSHLLGSSRPRG